MTPDELVAAFEASTLPPQEFRHREHLLVAFRYLEALPFARASRRFVDALTRFTRAHGVERKYDATTTRVYLVALAEAMADAPDATFDELLAQRPDFFDRDFVRRRLLHAAGAGAEDRGRAGVLPRRG